MFKYTVKRLLQSVLTVLIIVTIVFLCMRALPTDFFFTEDQMMKLDDQQKEDILAKAGLLDPIPTQLFHPLSPRDRTSRPHFLHNLPLSRKKAAVH